MEIQPVSRNDQAELAWYTHPSLAPDQVPAPIHPLADRDGKVPIEVFDAPPEMMRAVLAAPIRAAGDTSSVPAPTIGSDAPTVTTGRPSHGSSVDLEL